MGESVNLEFARGESESCHIVDILQDELCEHPVPENFFADLAYVSGIQDITIVRDVTQVLIDDSNEPECGELEYVVCSLGSIMGVTTIGAGRAVAQPLFSISNLA